MYFKSFGSIVLIIASVTANLSLDNQVQKLEQQYEKAVKNEINGGTSSSANWQLVFSDEFSGTSLDTRKWEYQTGCGETYGKRNQQCYMAGLNNVQVKDGFLVITAKIQKNQDKKFTSGRIRQLGSGSLYGKYVFRARLPAGARLWPGLWLKSKSTDCYQEIDVLETQGENPSRLIFTAHLGLNTNNIVRHGTATETKIDVVNEFHNFEIIWSPKSINWYVDDKLFHQVSLARSDWVQPGKTPCAIQPFSQAENLVINLAVNGAMYNLDYEMLNPETARQNWTKSTLEVDYVRVYQLK